MDLTRELRVCDRQIASCQRESETLKHLLALGADLTLRDRMGGTALDDAIRERCFRAMQMLYDAGARPEGMKVAVQLCQAASEGDAQLVGLLTSKGASPNNGASPCFLRRWGVCRAAEYPRSPFPRAVTLLPQPDTADLLRAGRNGTRRGLRQPHVPASGGKRRLGVGGRPAAEGSGHRA